MSVTRQSTCQDSRTMVEFVSGRNACANGFRSGFGFKYCIIDGGRTPSRREARMATMEMKRATVANRSVW
jgi:hypothetical protein